MNLNRGWGQGASDPHLYLLLILIRSEWLVICSFCLAQGKRKCFAHGFLGQCCQRENMRVYVCWTLRLAPETGMDLLDRWRCGQNPEDHQIWDLMGPKPQAMVPWVPGFTTQRGWGVVASPPLCLRPWRTPAPSWVGSVSGRAARGTLCTAGFRVFILWYFSVNHHEYIYPVHYCSLVYF